MNHKVPAWLFEPHDIERQMALIDYAVAEGAPTPPRRPVTVSTDEDVIVMRIQPWMAANTVGAVYQWIQRRLIGGRSRAPSIRNVALLRFVLSHTDEDGDRPSWAELLKLWNRTHKAKKNNWRYSTKASRNFARDFERARRAITRGMKSYD